MSTRKTILTLTLTLIVLALHTTPSGANLTRELTGTIGGSFEGAIGIAVDLETGNVYVIDGNTNTVNIYSANGGTPLGGVPSQITGQQFAGRGSGEEGINGIAVDNSCYEHEPRLTETTTPTCKEFDPYYGDIYIPHRVYGLRRFALNAQNKYEEIDEIPVEEVGGGGAGAGGEADGVSVDSQGNVYVGSGLRELILEYKTSGKTVKIVDSFVNEVKDLAVDGHGDVYTSELIEHPNPTKPKPGQDVGVQKVGLDANDEIVSEVAFAPPSEAEIYREVAVNRTTGRVLVGDGGRVAEYSEAGGEPLMEFGSAEPVGGGLVGLTPVTAVAVNSDTGVAYVANSSRGDVDVFGPVVEPPGIPTEQPGVSDVTRTSALLAGTANPEGGSGSYWYEYAAGGEYEAGGREPYVHGGRTASTALLSAHADENIERVLLSGLLPSTTYHYRLVVHNANTTTYGPDQTFTTALATPPNAVTGIAGEVGATSATLIGSVDPKGLATSYVFEVGTSTSYGGARLFGNAGDGTGEIPVSVPLAYLVPGTTYHCRLAATSFDGTTYGQDETFTTPGISSQVSQPPTIPLIGTPQIQFPSIAGAITEPTKITTKSTTNARKFKSALKACQKKSRRKQRVACEKRAKRQYKKTA